MGTLLPEKRSGDDSSLRFLGFTLGDEEFGADMGLVHRIVKPPTLTRIPRARPHLLGVIAVRGGVVTLVDLRQLLGLSPTSWPKSARVLLIDLDGEQIGLLVDAVTHVRKVPLDRFESPISVGRGHAAAHILGIARPDKSTSVAVIDLVGVLAERLR